MPRRKPAPPKPAPAPAPGVLEPLLTIKDVEKILQASKPKIYKLMNMHGLPSLRIDGARRFEQAALRQWIEEQKTVS